MIKKCRSSSAWSVSVDNPIGIGFETSRKKHMIVTASDHPATPTVVLHNIGHGLWPFSIIPDYFRSVLVLFCLANARDNILVKTEYAVYVSKHATFIGKFISQFPQFHLILLFIVQSPFIPLCSDRWVSAKLGVLPVKLEA